jgi:hypothetical protein
MVFERGAFDITIRGEGFERFEGKRVWVSAVQPDHRAAIDAPHVVVVLEGRVAGGRFALSCAKGLDQSYAYPTWAVVIDADDSASCTPMTSSWPGNSTDGTATSSRRPPVGAWGRSGSRTRSSGTAPRSTSARGTSLRSVLWRNERTRSRSRAALSAHAGHRLEEPRIDALLAGVWVAAAQGVASGHDCDGWTNAGGDAPARRPFARRQYKKKGSMPLTLRGPWAR